MNTKKQLGKSNPFYICLLLSMVILLFFLSGCKVVESISEYNLPKGSRLSPKKENKEAVEASTFRKTDITVLASTFKSLNPYIPQDKSMDSILKQCYQGLMTMSSAGEMVGQLADEVILAEDAMSCVVVLGEKQFHDGTSVGFRDINYSWQKAKSGSYAKQVAAIKKITALANNQIRVEFQGSGLMNLYSLSFPIVPENSLENGKPLEIRGTGPYQLTEYKPMQTLKLKSAFNQLEITLSRTEQIVDKAFLNGLTDIYYTDEFPWYSFSEEILRNISKFPSDSFYYMGFQLKNGIMADVNIRRYLVNKLDWEALYKKAFLNHIIVQKLPFHRGRLWEESVGQEITDNNSLAIIDKNPILIGEKLKLLYPVEDKALEILAQNIKSEWEAYVTVDIIGLSLTDYLTALQAGEFDVYLTKSKVSEYSNMADFFYTGGEYNYTQINILDNMVNAFLTAKTEEEQKNAYLALAKEIESSLWIKPFGFLENAVILSNQINGNLTSKTYDILSGITEIKVVE